MKSPVDQVDRSEERRPGQRSPPVAIIPAAGHATRLKGLGSTGSKEILPVGYSPAFPGGRPVIDHVLERLSLGGLEKALIVTRPDKGDIERTLGTIRHQIELHYLYTAATPSSVHTLATALRDDDPAGEREGSSRTSWILAFPDILFDPPDACAALRQGLDEGCDLVLALFPCQAPEASDMVRLDSRGQVVDLIIKGSDVGLTYTWGLAAWGPRFTSLLLDTVRAADSESQESPLLQPPRELFVGHVIRQALARGLAVSTVPFPRGRILDIGTPAALERARNRLH